ncbi:MAG: hypothetical protein V8T40_01440 [Phocaeicola vulgatus]
MAFRINSSFFIVVLFLFVQSKYTIFPAIYAGEGLFYSETAASCVHLSVSATIEVIISASGDIALFFVSEASASPQKPVNRAKRLKDCLWKFLQPDYGSFSFWLFGMCLWKFIFSGAFMPVGNDVTIRKSLL